MSLEMTLSDIVCKLRENKFLTESTIATGVVLRVLNDLNWSVFDPAVVWPEYSTGIERVDFALCEPPEKPRVFIVVKRPGGIEDGVRQSLEYAFRTDVPMVVLTDGKIWRFYLSGEQDDHDREAIATLNLFESSVSKAADTLERYIERSRVAKGESLDTAREEYEIQNRLARSRRQIPEAWNNLVNNRDELLIELVADAVESQAHIRPENVDVINFLFTLRRSIAPSSIGSAALDKHEASQSVIVPHRRTRSGTLHLLGENIEYKNAADAEYIILNRLQGMNPNFLSTLYAHSSNKGSKLRYVARSVEELFPNRPDMYRLHRRLRDGWLLSIKTTNQQKVKLLRGAADVAGLMYGRDIIVGFGS